MALGMGTVMDSTRPRTTARHIGTWLAVLLLAATGSWLLLSPRPVDDTATAPPPAAPTEQQTSVPAAGPLLDGPAARPAPTAHPAGEGRASTPGTPSTPTGASQSAEDHEPAQLPQSWSTAAPDEDALVDQDWVPSDHSGTGPAPTGPPPEDEARRQLGQVFPRHLPPDEPGVEKAVQAARDVLELDLQTTSIGDDLQHVAALVLTPDTETKRLEDLDRVDVVVQVEIRTKMDTEELRIYRVTLARNGSSGWAGQDISIV